MITNLFTNSIATESADLLCNREEVTRLLPICSHLRRISARSPVSIASIKKPQVRRYLTS
jgi:hypothetical protein